MPAMIRKSGLKQLKKFKQFINKGGGDISKKLKDKTTTDTLNKNISTYESEQYLSDEDIEAGYDNYKITEFSVDILYDDGGASGWIAVEFPSDDEDYGTESKTDHWLKYDSGPKIAFDNWYPEKMNQQLKKYIEKGIKKEKIKREAEKYNL